MAEPDVRKSLSYYHSANQLRFDTWHELEQHTQRLAERHARKKSVARLRKTVDEALSILETIEFYTAFPSHDDFSYIWKLFEREEYRSLARVVSRVVRALSSHSYRRRSIQLARALERDELDDEEDVSELSAGRDPLTTRPYFEVLVVDEISPEEERGLRVGLRDMRRAEDRFVYDTVVVPSFEDALIAVLFNYNIQCVVIRYGFPFHSSNKLEVLQRYIAGLDDGDAEEQTDVDRGPLLGSILAELRPELDLYLVTDVAVEAIAGDVTQSFKRIFYRQEDYLELHLSLLRGIGTRYQTPFFTALREYSRQPTGVFHAMPISRGKSITKSHWIQDMVQFYGINIFLAETSATSGGDRKSVV